MQDCSTSTILFAPLMIYCPPTHPPPIDWLMQERRNSSALAMELQLSCTNPLICISYLCKICNNSTVFLQEIVLKRDYLLHCHHSGTGGVGLYAQIAKFMGPTWGPPGSCRPQMGPMLAPWILLSGWLRLFFSTNPSSFFLIMPFFMYASLALYLPLTHSRKFATQKKVWQLLMYIFFSKQLPHTSSREKKRKKKKKKKY